MGRGADDLVRRGDRGIRAVKGRKQPDRADRRGTRTAHVVVLPGMRGHVHASGSEHTADVTADGFRTVRVSDSGETDNQDGEKRAFASESPETDTKGASQTYDAAGERFETVPVDQVQLGDVILVLPGETVPVDGELLSGVATLDLSNINGEPVPREVYAALA